MTLYSVSGSVILLLISLGILVLMALIILIFHVRRKTSRKIEESESLLRAITKNAADVIITITKKGQVTFFNDAAVKLLGYEVSEVIGNNVSMLMSSQLGSQHDGFLNNYLTTGEQKVIGVGRDVEARHKDGRIIPVRLSVGKASHLGETIFIGVLHDRSELKRVQYALQEKEDLYRNIFNRAPVGIALIAPDGHFTEMNDHLRSIFGYINDQLLGQHIHDLVPDDERDSFDRKFDSLLVDNAFISFDDAPWQKKDGTIVWVNSTVTVNWQSQKEKTYLSLVVEDISVQKQAMADLKLRQKALEVSRKAALSIMQDANKEKIRAEKALQELAESEQERTKLSIAVEQSPASVVITDISGNIEYVNPVFLEKTGYMLEEVIGQNPRFLSSGHTSPKEYEELWTAITNGKEWVGEFYNRKKNGDFYWESAVIGPVKDSQSKITHFMAIKEDITARKKTEQELANERIRLKKSREEAYAANKAKSDFLATMSHEIRTPMNAIIGMSHLALQTDLTRQQRNYLEKVSISSENLLTIINDILDFSKIEAGQLSLEYVDYYIDKVLDNLANVASIKAEEKELELIFAMDPEMPTNLIGDPLRLGQIMLNLVGNAIKFTEKGEVVVASKLLELTNEKAKILFSVSDSGIGISLENQSKMFKAFSQADASTTRKYGGTGLGLSICKQLVEMMGGEIWLASEEGKGSCFYFTADLNYNKDMDRVRPVDLTEMLMGMRVLVIDDNEAAQLILSEMLLNIGFKVDCAISGSDGLKLIDTAINKELPYQLILVDWKMPDMDGIETVHEIQLREGISGCPTIIMVTAYCAEELSRQLEGEKISALLTKPVNHSTLFDTIIQALGKEIIKAPLMQRSGPEEQAIENLAGAKILLVEDNEFNQEFAVDLLSNAGLKVMVADNGEQALALLEEQSFDGVLMDVQMPVMDGLAASREIRKQPKFATLPILALTANVMSGDKQLALASGMNDCVAKPINVSELFEKMAQWISPSQAIGLSQLSSEKVSYGNFKIPAIQGIDIAEGLERFRNDHLSYQKFLMKFVQNQSDFIQEIREADRQGKSKDVARMAHTLKGLAGTIAAQELYHCATTLEGVIANEVPIKDCLTELELHLDHIISGISNALTQDKKSLDEDELDEPVDTGVLLSVLQELKSLLISSSATAVDFVDSHHQKLNDKSLGDLGIKLMALVEAYDFERALSCLQEITDKVNLDNMSSH